MVRELWDNPMGTDGFEFVEYTGPEPTELDGAVRPDGAYRGGAAPLEKCHAL